MGTPGSAAQTCVDVFFVISGYLISSIIFKNVAANSFSISDFYSRRILRIFPALILVLIVFFIIGWFSLLNHEFASYSKHVFGGSIFISNFFLWFESGYFDSSSELKPLLHLWSLAIEEQFYILWPAFVVFFLYRFKKPFYVLCFLTLISFFYSVHLTQLNKTAAFYSPLSRFWEILLGACYAYHSALSIKSKSHLKNEFKSFIGLTFILGSALVINQKSQFPGFLALFPSLGSLLIISAGTDTKLNKIILSHPILVNIGLISYPLYLWHWPIFSFSRILVGTEPSEISRLILLFMSILLAWLTYKYFELPLRKHFKKRTKIITLVLCMLFLGLFSFFTYKQNGFEFRYIVSDNDLEKRDWSLSTKNSVDCGTIRTGESTRFCVQTSNEPVLALIGDSHAGHLLNGFSEALEAPFNQVILMGAGGCQAASGIKTAQNCQKILEESINFIKSQPQLKYVLIGNYQGFLDDLSVDEIEDYRRGFLKTIEALTKLGKKVIFVIDNPTLKDSAERCVESQLRLRSLIKEIPAFCDKTKMTDFKDHSKYKTFVESLAQPKNLYFFDSQAALCKDNICEIYDINNRLLYSDNNHLSKYGSELVVKKIVSFLKSL